MEKFKWRIEKLGPDQEFRKCMRGRRDDDDDDDDGGELSVTLCKCKW